MKKFLAYLLVIVLTVSLGFAVFYLVNDNEVISLSTTSLYKDAGSTFELALDIKKENSYTKIDVMSSDENVIAIEKEEINIGKGIAKATFVAKTGGVARVNFQTNNSKFRNLYCDITIGDGSKENPFYISTPAQLSRIGKTLDAGEENPYTLSSCYEIVANLDMSEVGEKWEPIGNEANPFTGTINGNGYTIYNLNVIDSVSNNIGLISNIGIGGSVSNVKFDNVKIVSGSATENIGCVAGVNNGNIERIEVKNLIVENNYEAVNIGGIAGQNLSQINTVSTVNARISRCSAVIDFHGGMSGDTKLNVKGVIGGITAQNIGGTVINCYTKGSAKLGEFVSTYGGIVGHNEYLQNTGLATGYSEDLGARIKDCYTIVVTGYTLTDPSQNIGALIGENIDNDVNSIIGLYYSDTCVDATIFGVGQALNDEVNVITRLTNDKMKDLSNYLSYVEQVPYVDAGVVKYKDGNNIYWNTQVWSVQGNVNDGYPALNYSAMEVNDNFPTMGGEILTGTPAQLNQMLLNDLSGSFIISQDYDFTGYDWIPVGTKDRPFQGSIEAAFNSTEGRYYKITGLHTADVVENNEAGLFGAIGENASVKNIVLENVNISNSNYIVAGAIVARNGWNNGRGGSVQNCTVINGTVSAKNYVGGIAGINDGTIQGCTVIGQNYVVGDVVTQEASLTISATSNEKIWVGGITGQNNSNIYGDPQNYSSVKGLVAIKSEDKVTKANLGGIAGQNDGDIKYVKLSINTSYNKNNFGVISNAAGANLGGVAGTSTGTISNAGVSARVLGNESSNTFAGGIVGNLIANNETDVTAHNIQDSVVYDSNISANKVGGIVGYLTTEYSQSYDINNEYIEKWYAEQLTIDNDTYNTNLKVAVFGVAVEDSVVLDGDETGGFAHTINRGVVYNCYTKAQLKGSGNAGLVFTIKFNSSNKTGGLISRCYAIVNLKAGSDNYYVSSSNVHAESNIKKRTAGFIDNYYYAVGSDHNGKEPTYNGGIIIGFGNLFTSDEDTISLRKRDMSTLEKSSTWKSFLSDDPVTGDLSIWNVVGGSLPSLPNAEINK